MKVTNVKIGDESIPTYKDPITDNGTKKSAVGYLRVRLENDEYVLDENVTEAEEAEGELKTVFLDGKITSTTTLQEIRDRLAASRAKVRAQRLSNAVPKAA